MVRIDTSFVHARPFLAPQTARVTLALCGLGGTGSWLAPHVVRIARALEEAGRQVEVLFIDPDVVEERNLTRQNFCQAEVGMQKAATLALRYGAAWQCVVEAVCAPFDEALISRSGDRVCVLIGAVDNAAARRSLNAILRRNSERAGTRPPLYLYLDLGNARESGQCLLGTASTVEDLRDAFATPGICRALPAPLLQDPSLSQARPEEAEAAFTHKEQGGGVLAPGTTDTQDTQDAHETQGGHLRRSRRSARPVQATQEVREVDDLVGAAGTRTAVGLSCAELLQANLQSPAINPLMATIGAEYLWSLLLTGGVRRFATYLSLSPGVMASSWTTPEQVARAVAVAPTFFPHMTTFPAARPARQRP